MYTRLELSEQSLHIVGEEGVPTLTHSVYLAKRNLTMGYWDALAWAVMRSEATNLLLLGLGGGTVLQLLKAHGRMPDCTAVEIDDSHPARLARDRWLSYPRLKVVYADAREFLSRTIPEQFDAVVVDLYNNNGYVEEAYSAEILASAVALLTSRGVIILNCFDPAAKYLSFGLTFEPPLPSPALAVAHRIAALGLEVTVHPQWSSMAVVGKRYNRGSNQDLCLKSSPLRWLNLFNLATSKRIEEMQATLTPMSSDYTFEALNNIDLVARVSVARSLPEAVQSAMLDNLLEKSKPNHHNSKVMEHSYKGMNDLNVETVICALRLEALLSAGIASPSLQPVVDEIEKIARFSANPYLRYVSSYAHAYLDRWDKAIGELVA